MLGSLATSGGTIIPTLGCGFFRWRLANHLNMSVGDLPPYGSDLAQPVGFSASFAAALALADCGGAATHSARPPGGPQGTAPAGIYNNIIIVNLIIKSHDFKSGSKRLNS